MKCEVLVGPTVGPMCGRNATFRYPAMGGGYMYLCDGHGIKHAAHSEVWHEGQWIGATCDSSDDASEQSDSDRRER